VSKITCSSKYVNDKYEVSVIGSVSEISCMNLSYGDTCHSDYSCSRRLFKNGGIYLPIMHLDRNSRTLRKKTLRNNLSLCRYLSFRTQL